MDRAEKAGADFMKRLMLASHASAPPTKPVAKPAAQPPAPPSEKKVSSEEIPSSAAKRAQQIADDDTKALAVLQSFPEYFDRVTDAVGFANLQKVMAYLKIYGHYLTGWTVREAVTRLAEKGQLQTCEPEPAAPATPAPAPAISTPISTPPPAAPAAPVKPVDELPPLPKWMVDAMGATNFGAART